MILINQSNLILLSVFEQYKIDFTRSRKENPSLRYFHADFLLCGQHHSQHAEEYIYDDVINGNIVRVTGLLCGEFTGHR